jgi:transposase-like protein
MNTGIRWSTYRKAAIVDQITRGEMTMKEAQDRYSLSSEEFNSWQRAYIYEGHRGLRVKRLLERRRLTAKHSKTL